MCAREIQSPLESPLWVLAWWHLFFTLTPHLCGEKCARENCNHGNKKRGAEVFSAVPGSFSSRPSTHREGTTLHLGTPQLDSFLYLWACWHRGCVSSPVVWLHSHSQSLSFPSFWRIQDVNQNTTPASRPPYKLPEPMLLEFCPSVEPGNICSLSFILFEWRSWGILSAVSLKL